MALENGIENGIGTWHWKTALEIRIGKWRETQVLENIIGNDIGHLGCKMVLESSIGKRR
jgi:hypothetical protein